MTGIDYFCSSSDWVLPAEDALMPRRDSWIYRDGDCFWALMRGEHAQGLRYLEPLEAMWSLACPIIGSHIGTLMAGIHWLCSAPRSDWQILILSGLPRTHPLYVGVVHDFGDHVRRGQSSVRLVVDLETGFDAFLSRRSKQFRRSLTRCQRQAAANHVSIEDASTEMSHRVFERIMAVEARSWKGRDVVGITTGRMHDFYKSMVTRLRGRGAQRVLFARHAGMDVAYILGGMRWGGYRGLQFSYDYEYKKYGLGNLLQAEQIRLLCEEGATSYDLGMHMEYKIRWADREHETESLFLIR